MNLAVQIHTVGTVRTNSQHISKTFVDQKLKRSEIISLHNYLKVILEMYTIKGKSKGNRQF